MKATLFEDDYRKLERDLADVEFVVSVIKDYYMRELDAGCREMLKKALTYFEGSRDVMKVDLQFFTPVPRPKFSEVD